MALHSRSAGPLALFFTATKVGQLITCILLAVPEERDGSSRYVAGMSWGHLGYMRLMVGMPVNVRWPRSV